MKVAILGTAPSVVRAPFADESWEIWGVSPVQFPRLDRWVEIHDEALLRREDHKAYWDWLIAQTKPIYMQKVFSEIPASREYPLKAVTDRFGDWFLTSSVSYALALAMIEGATEIALWGVDMATGTEYGAQKAGCRFFIQMARIHGINVTVAKESELLVPGKMYGYQPDVSWLFEKSTARKAELEARIVMIKGSRQRLRDESLLLKGKLDITLTEDAIRARLAEIATHDVELQQQEWTLDGALQDQDHVLNNWA